MELEASDATPSPTMAPTTAPTAPLTMLAAPVAGGRSGDGVRGLSGAFFCGGAKFRGPERPRSMLRRMFGLPEGDGARPLDEPPAGRSPAGGGAAALGPGLAPVPLIREAAVEVGREAGAAGRARERETVFRSLSDWAAADESVGAAPEGAVAAAGGAVSGGRMGEMTREAPGALGPEGGVWVPREPDGLGPVGERAGGMARERERFLAGVLEGGEAAGVVAPPCAAAAASLSAAWPVPDPCREMGSVRARPRFADLPEGDLGLVGV